MSHCWITWHYNAGDHTLHSCHHKNLKLNNSGSILYKHIYFYLPWHMFSKLPHVKPELMQCLSCFHQPYSGLYHVNQCCNSRDHKNFSQCQIWTQHSKNFYVSITRSDTQSSGGYSTCCKQIYQCENLGIVVFICSLLMLSALSWTGHPIIPRLHFHNLCN